jgi:hypothetical protein
LEKGHIGKGHIGRKRPHWKKATLEIGHIGKRPHQFEQIISIGSYHKKQKQRHSLNKSSTSDHIIKNKNSATV